MNELPPDEPSSAGAAGEMTVTPSARSASARVKAVGTASAAPSGAGTTAPPSVVRAKSVPRSRRGISAAMTLPCRSVAATQ